MKSPGSLSRLVGETRVSQTAPGVTLLSRQTAANEIVAVEMVLPMGGREEEPDQAGIGTLALRMLTRGTETKSDYDIAVGFESIGSSFSTDIQKDRAVLSVQTTLYHFEDTMKLVEEVLTEPTFLLEYFQIEQEILKKEILEDLDSPYYAAIRLFQRTLFGEHPYAKPNSGTLETVSELTRDQAITHFEKGIRKGPVSIGVVGNLSEPQIDSAMGGIFRFFANEGSVAPPSASFGKPIRVSDSQAYEIRSTDSECMVYGFPVPGLHDPSYASLKVLDSIMGGSMDSRLFTEVREKQGLVYQIGSAYPGLEWGSFFSISLITTLQNHDKVLETLAREIERVRTDPPDRDEIERSKTYLFGTYLMSQEKNSDQALLLARYHSLGLGIEFIDRYPTLIESVTAESLRAVCCEYFLNPTLAIVGPGPKVE